MGVSKIEQLIEDIYDFIEHCKSPAFMQSKVIVPKDELYDLLDELRFRTPDEIKRYQKIIANRDAIISDAQEKAETMIAEAREQTYMIINESEMVQQAYQQANDIIEQAVKERNKMIEEANADADQIRSSALVYTGDLLINAEHIIKNAYDSSKSKFELLMNSLKDNLDIIDNNKKELMPQKEPIAEEMEDTLQEAFAETAAEDDFEFDEDTFLEDID